MTAALLVALLSDPPPELLLELGIRQVDDGDFEAAVFTLDTVVRRLAGKSGRARGLAQAYLYLGVAYVGLGHEVAARGKFREALRLSQDLRLDPARSRPVPSQCSKHNA